MDYASECREAQGLFEAKDVLVSLVWMSPTHKQLFEAFPEKLSVDGTHCTQREKYELITFCNYDQAGGTEVIVKCWAPNTRAWFYQWLFGHAFPSLAGREACKRVRLVISDGD